MGRLVRRATVIKQNAAMVCTIQPHYEMERMVPLCALLCLSCSDANAVSMVVRNITLDWRIREYIVDV